MRQARVFLMQNPDVLPLPHIENVNLYGGVDRYVIAGGVDINKPEGNRILNWETALYLVCLDLCYMGAGNRPYQPHPFMRDPVIVAEPEGEAAGVQPQQPAADVPAPAAPDHPAVRIVRVEGNIFPPPPPLRPAPVAPAPPLQQYFAQPLHWVFREPPRESEAKPKLEPKREAGVTEYIEPAEETPSGSK
jgi:hypothetical protein